MARKKPHEEHENHERWLVSYADFITLLFAFFVVMYSISSVNEGKYRVLSDALVAAFRSSPKSLLPIQVGSPSKSPVVSTAQEDLRSPGLVKLPKMFISQNENEEGKPRDPLIEEKFEEGGDRVVLEKIADDVREALSELVKKGLITVHQEALWVEVEIRNSVLFPSGSAVLQASAVPVLEEVARILADHDNSIRVEGFTDNVPIHTVVYPSNWELSAARASSVVRLFMDNGISPQRMVAQGYGEYRPVASNDTPEGRAQNRRVVIVVLADKLVEQLLYEHGHVEKISREIRATIEGRSWGMPGAAGDAEAGTATAVPAPSPAQELPPSPGAPASAVDGTPPRVEERTAARVGRREAVPAAPAAGPISGELGIVRPLGLAPFRLSVPIRVRGDAGSTTPGEEGGAARPAPPAADEGETLSDITRFE